MPPMNPNALTDEAYWLLYNNAPPFTPVAQSVRRAPPRSWFGRMIEDMASAYRAPVPALAAYSANGAYVSTPGSREAYQVYNIPPVMMQRSPYATAAYRTYVDPYGQLGVQPLAGFPSTYPHVLSGVPNGPFRTMGFINALLPRAGFLPFMGMPPIGAPAQPRAAGRAAKNPANTAPAQPSAWEYGPDRSMIPQQPQSFKPATAAATPETPMPWMDAYNLGKGVVPDIFDAVPSTGKQVGAAAAAAAAGAAVAPVVPIEPVAPVSAPIPSAVETPPGGSVWDRYFNLLNQSAKDASRRLPGKR